MPRFFHPPPARHPVTAESPRFPVEPAGALLARRYRVESLLTSGGFAHLYLARDLKLGVARAVKEALYFDSASQRQFAEEADLLINCKHPHLVHGYAYHADGPKQFLIMEYIDGPTVEDVVIDYVKTWRHAPPAITAIDWLIPICDAAHSLHCQPVPIIHRDIKPANIQIERASGKPMLIDLGLAKRQVSGQRTQAAALAFTPGYAPPEQYQASGTTGPLTDVYALGATLYFLLTSYQPVESPARLTGTLQPAPSTRNAQVSSVLDAIVLRAMALDPRERYASAADLANELRAAREALEGSGRAHPGYASGGPLPGRTCGQCRTQNPGVALYCFHCGCAFSAALQDADLFQIDESVQPSPSLYVMRTTPLPAGSLAARSPRLDLAHENVAKVRAAAQPMSEARGTILALISGVCVALGLVSFVSKALLLGPLVGVVLAHYLLGLSVFSRVVGWKLAWRAHQSPMLRRVPWHPLAVDPDLRRFLPWIALTGYLILAASIVLMLRH